ncbi:MAG: DUF4375 domain-containing protein [Gemmatimonadaceae bacterium]|nr:DUF4375 domain-containing protein [Gemmatimonadaceae bacterium]
MDHAQLEHLINSRIRAAAEQAIVDAIREVNESGRCFQRVDDTLIQWREAESAETLHVWCTIAVDMRATDLTRDGRESDTLARLVQSGDAEAVLLSRLEGGVANGGLYQTLVNNDEALLVDCAVVLRRIGAKSTLRMIEHALELWREHTQTRQQMDQLRADLHRLDQRWWKRQEDGAVLYDRAQRDDMDRAR